MKILQIATDSIEYTHTHICILQEKIYNEYVNKEHSELKDFIIGIILVYQKYTNVILFLYA
jgi:hypothetical protein